MIRLILYDGDPEGLRAASMAGRTTVLFACPWAQRPLLMEREEAKRPAVYLLVGFADVVGAEGAFEQAIYIGECDSLKERFEGKHHKSDSAEWTQIFLATTSEGTFNKAHARQAEYRLREKALEAKRSAVLTKSASPGKIDEGDAAFAQEFVSNVIVLAETLGLGVFRPPVSMKIAAASKAVSGIGTTGLPTNAATATDVAPTAIFSFDYTSSKIPAKMALDGSEFVILSGSYARAKEGIGLSVTVREKRRLALEAGTLVKTDDPDFLRFTADLPMTSSSAAGAMVYGSSCAGPIAWRHDGTGLLMKDWQLSQKGTADG
jgi:hypothetical protein